jgi:allantoin racemase
VSNTAVRRMWYQSMTELERVAPYGPVLEGRLRDILGNDFDVSVQGIAKDSYSGAEPLRALPYPPVYLRILSQVVDLAEQAEREGYEVFVMGSFSEPFLREVRSAVQIPVASMAESSMLVACSASRRFGLVTLSAEARFMAEKIIERHVLDGRCAGIFVMTGSLTERELSAALTDPGDVVDRFVVAAEAAIAHGADVVVPAEGILNEVVQKYGRREIQGVSVMDTVATTALFAQLLVSAQALTGLHAGRRWEYPYLER